MNRFTLKMKTHVSTFDEVLLACSWFLLNCTINNGSYYYGLKLCRSIFSWTEQLIRVLTRIRITDCSRDIALICDDILS